MDRAWALRLAFQELWFVVGSRDARSGQAALGLGSMKLRTLLHPQIEGMLLPFQLEGSLSPNPDLCLASQTRLFISLPSPGPPSVFLSTREAGMQTELMATGDQRWGARDRTACVVFVTLGNRERGQVERPVGQREV